jgi:3-methyladenine DNA glycosylase AlkD
MNIDEVMSILKSKENETNKKGMERFGINVSNAFGISIKELEPIAKQIKINHKLAIDL